MPPGGAAFDDAGDEPPMRVADRVVAGLVVGRVAGVVELHRGASLGEPGPSIHGQAGLEAVFKGIQGALGPADIGAFEHRAVGGVQSGQ
jgi:hypothetical protein